MIHDKQRCWFDFFPSRRIEIQQVDEHVSSDGGLVVFRELDQKLGLTQSFSEMIVDRRVNPKQPLTSVVRQRIFGILAGYEDQNDHDTLRGDPVFKMIADRTVDDNDLASQPTISRLENAVTPRDLLNLEDWFINAFVNSFDEPPRRVTIDVDTIADPAHGAQQLTFFNGFYNQNQYQIRAITCAENEQIVLPELLFGTAPVAVGIGEQLLRVIDVLRSRYPDLEIHIRADSGFATPELYEPLESRAGVTYSIGYQMNPLMQKKSEELLENAKVAYEQTGEEQRRFMHFRHRSRYWKRERDLVVKCEVNAAGETNRRAIITNRPGAAQYPDGTYQEYADRGESENRNKELSVDLGGDRLSDHRYMANLFRLMMHTVAYNLLARLRAVTSLPDTTPEFDEKGMPHEASSEYNKRTQRNRRRRRDPLARGQAMTWRMLIIKVAARVVTRSRCIRLLIPSHWPHANHLFRVSRLLACYHPSG